MSILCWNCGSDQVNRMPEGHLRCDTCYTDWVPKPMVRRGPGPRPNTTAYDPFEEHLEYASHVVGTWPKWKQSVLGVPILYDPKQWPPDWIAW